MKPLVLVLSAVSLVLALAACGGGGAQSAGPAPSVPTETQPPALSPGDSEQPATTGPHCADPRPWDLWLIRDAGTATAEDGTEVAFGPRLFRVTRTGEELAALAVAEGTYRPDDIQYALCPLHNGIEWILFDALRAGPYRDEAAAGVTSAFPAEAPYPTDYNYLPAGIYVDLPSEFEAGASTLELRLRLAQFIFTMWAAGEPGPGEGINISIDGEPVDVLSADGTVLDGPVTREDFADLLPPIIVEVPEIWADVTMPPRIAGTADALAATVKARVLDFDGNVLAEATATPTAGSRGDFSFEIPFELSQCQPGSVQVEGHDADGGSIGLVEIPVWLWPAGSGPSCSYTG
jgi:hypothetical protein